MIKRFAVEDSGTIAVATSMPLKAAITGKPPTVEVWVYDTGMERVATPATIESEPALAALAPVDPARLNVPEPTEEL
mgnify:CR=1 FL=1